MDDSLFTTHIHNIDVKEYDNPIYLIPFGDIHRFAHLCHTEKWQEFLDWAKSKERCYFLGMGDYDDLMSTSERCKFASANFHESTVETLDDIYEERTHQFYKEIEFMRGRVIGLIEGNHFGKFQSGITTTQKLCEKLQCRYLGVSSFIRLSFGDVGHSNSRASIDIWAHHGKGAARLIGGSLNSVQQMAENAFADIYLMGHDHKKSIGIKSILLLKKGGGGIRLSHKKQLFVRTGSFLKGYEPNKDSYVAKRGLSPTDLGVVKIEMTPKRKQTKYYESYYVDLHASI